MKAWHKITLLISLLAIIYYLCVTLSPALKKGYPTSSPTSPIVSETPMASDSAVINPSGQCSIHGDLPDPSCTPGATDSRVTQENINQTICVSGYTKTVRPSATYTNKLKMQQISAYGYSDTNTRDYEEDHLISLELGGAPSDPNNLWPEPGASPNQKDKIENLCHQKVCLGEITLSLAQHQIVSDWHTACQ